MPYFSIIIPTFNSGAVLDRALASVVSQTFNDWEIVLIDGASSDNTLEIAQSYQDNRIRIFSEPDQGVYDAMNKGIDIAAGKWLYFLGSDDYLLKDDVLTQVTNHIPTKCDVFYGDVEASQLDARHKGEWNFNDIEYNRCHQAVFYNRKVFHKLGKYNLKYTVFADHDMNLKWFLNKKIISYYYPIIIAHYSDGGLSVQQTDSLFTFDFPIIVLLYGWAKLKWKEKQPYIILAKQRLHYKIKKTKNNFFSFILRRKK